MKVVNLEVMAIFVVTMVILFSVSASAQTAQAGKANYRVLDQQESAKYVERVKSLSSEYTPATPTSTVPASVIYTTGSSYTGITVQGINAIDLPDGTVMVGVKSQSGLYNQRVLYSVMIGGTLPAGAFVYPFEKELHGVWTEQPALLTYQLFTLFPDGSTSLTTAYQEFNKFWTAYIGPPKMISEASCVLSGGNLYVQLTGPITSSRSLAVVVKDPDLDYVQLAIPSSAIRRNKAQILLNLTAAGFAHAPNNPIAVIVTGDNGVADQYVVRTPIQPVVLPAE